MKIKIIKELEKKEEKKKMKILKKDCILHNEFIRIDYNLEL